MLDAVHRLCRVCGPDVDVVRRRSGCLSVCRCRDAVLLKLRLWRSKRKRRVLNLKSNVDNLSPIQIERNCADFINLEYCKYLCQSKSVGDLEAIFIFNFMRVFVFGKFGKNVC